MSVDVDEEDHQRAKDCRWQSRRPIAHTPGRLVGQHGSPVVKRRLFQPGLTGQDRGDPIAALQHFPRDLRIAGLVSSYQSVDLQAGKKQESAECDEGENVGGTAGAFLHDAVLFQCSIRSLGDSYCTAAR
jgi:hypothetical protein